MIIVPSSPLACEFSNTAHLKVFPWARSKAFLIQAYSFFSLFLSIRDTCAAKGQKVIIMHPVCTEAICPAPTPAGFFSSYICTG